MSKDTRQEVALWQARIRASENVQKKERAIWRRLIDFYENKQWLNSTWDEDLKLTCNLFFSYVRTMIPSLIFKSPYVYIRPRKPAFEDKVKLIETLINYFVQECDLKKQARYALLDAFFSFGVIKCGYTAHMETNQNAGEFLRDPEGNILRESDGTPQLAKGSFLKDQTGEPLIDPDTGEPLLEPPNILIGESFFFDRISPEDIYFPIDSVNDPERTDWIAQRFVRRVKDAKKDTNYDAKQRKLIKATGSIREESKDIDLSTHYSEEVKQFLKEESETCEIFEIWDVRERRVKTIVSGVSDYLRNEPYPKGIEKHPFSFLKFNERPDRILPLPELLPGESLQKEYNESRTMMMVHRKRFGRKYEALKGILTQDEMTKLKEGPDGTIIEVPSLGSIQPIKDAPLDPVAYSQPPSTKEDWREIMGISGERMGTSGTSTATAASIVETASQTRVGDKLDLVTDWFKLISRKQLQSMQANLTLPGVIKIAGAEGEQWVEYDPKQGDLEGEYDTNVEVGSSAPKNIESERQQIIELLGVLGQNPWLLQRQDGTQRIDLDILMKEIIERFQIENQRILTMPQQQAISPQQGVMPTLNPGAMSGGMNAGNMAQQAAGGNGGAMPANSGMKNT